MRLTSPRPTADPLRGTERVRGVRLLEIARPLFRFRGRCGPGVHRRGRLRGATNGRRLIVFDCFAENDQSAERTGIQCRVAEARSRGHEVILAQVRAISERRMSHPDGALDRAPGLFAGCGSGRAGTGLSISA